jgi:hypothetical protein
MTSPFRGAGVRCVRSVIFLRVAIAAALVTASWLAVSQGDRQGSVARAADRFPHERHEGLFPSCSACHTTKNGEDSLYIVTESDCASCHDGETLVRVSWSPPPKKPTNLVFDHNFHVNEAGIACADCHGVPGSTNRMDVLRPTPEKCLTCHEAASHLAPEAECTRCHVPLTQSTLTVDQIAAFPVPDSHLEADFFEHHGQLATAETDRCATCHSRELCETCHVNAEKVPVIQALGSDDREAQVFQGREGRWPRPKNHDDPEWIRSHGSAAAKAIQDCANCHVQESCTGCHRPLAPAAVSELPVERVEAPARGVTLPNAFPPGHGAGFLIEHRTAAATDNPRCATCHTEDLCASCHTTGMPDLAGAAAGARPRATGPVSRTGRDSGTPGFHERNYLARHAADAYARDLDCASCHSQEVFCRSCHENVGLSPQTPKSTAYHNAEPFWLITHGRAARQGLDNCESCHQQKDCLRCHSAKTGWRISPHGPDFDADRLGDRSLLMCSRCHFSDPRR